MAQIIAYNVVIHGRLDTRLAALVIFRTLKIEFYFQVLVIVFFIPCQEILTVYLYINLLFQIITSLALDNLSEFELVTIVITGYMLRYHT